MQALHEATGTAFDAVRKLGLKRNVVVFFPDLLVSGTEMGRKPLLFPRPFPAIPPLAVGSDRFDP